MTTSTLTKLADFYKSQGMQYPASQLKRDYFELAEMYEKLAQLEAEKLEIIARIDKCKIPTKRIDKMWKVWGIGLPVLRIEAESFDEALHIARAIDRGYSTGQIVRNEDLKDDR